MLTQHLLMEQTKHLLLKTLLVVWMQKQVRWRSDGLQLQLLRPLPLLLLLLLQQLQQTLQRQQRSLQRWLLLQLLLLHVDLC